MAVSIASQSFLLPSGVPERSRRYPLSTMEYIKYMAFCAGFEAGEPGAYASVFDELLTRPTLRDLHTFLRGLDSSVKKARCVEELACC